MAAVAPEAIFYYLVQAHGVSPATAAGILANIQAESGFNPAAIGDGGTSGGLFQHHAGRWTNLKNYAQSTGREWTDWRAQVDFAIQEARQMGINLAATDPAQAARDWTIRFERPANMQQKAEQRASQASRFMFGEGPPSLSLPMATTLGGMSVDPSVTPSFGASFPLGYTLYQVDGTLYMVYPFDPGMGASTMVYYRVDGARPHGAAQAMSAAAFQEMAATQGWVFAGSSFELQGQGGMSWEAIIERTLMDAGWWGTDALADPDVVRALAAFLGENVDPEVIANRLRFTNWYQQHTDLQRQWNDKSKAQQAQEIMTAAATLGGLWFTYLGEAIDISAYDGDGDGTVTPEELKAGNPELYQAAFDLASGARSQAQIVNETLKTLAFQNPNSPWMRTIRNEVAEQGEFNMRAAQFAGDVMDLHHRWGIEVPFEEARFLGRQMALNQLAIEELEERAKDMALVLYPHKPREVDTLTYSQPYRFMMQQLLETSDPGLFDPTVQRAMAEGMNLGDFRRLLRQDERWQHTVNARQEYTQVAARIGQMMGFV